jgi:hypothetical protein
MEFAEAATGLAALVTSLATLLRVLKTGRRLDRSDAFCQDRGYQGKSGRPPTQASSSSASTRNPETPAGT